MLPSAPPPGQGRGAAARQGAHPVKPDRRSSSGLPGSSSTPSHFKPRILVGGTGEAPDHLEQPEAIRGRHAAPGRYALTLGSARTRVRAARCRDPHPRLRGVGGDGPRVWLHPGALAGDRCWLLRAGLGRPGPVRLVGLAAGGEEEEDGEGPSGPSHVRLTPTRRRRP